MSRSDETKVQKQENKKHIRCLQSEKTALPRKRQLMKNLFGDYRSKMAREPLLPAASASISSSKSVESKGRFVRKAASIARKYFWRAETDGAHQCVSKRRSELNETHVFQFNFNVES